MCKCHRFNKTTRKLDRLSTGNKGDIFRFEHETFKRKIIDINYKSFEVFAPPIDSYSGMDEREEHVFHRSFKVIWGEV